MADDLLEQLETATSVPGNLENIEDLMHHVTREVNRAVESLQGSARTFENAWQRIVMDVARGQTTQMQAIRPRFLQAFEKRLDLLKRTSALAICLRDVAGFAEQDVLMPEIAGMERLKAKVFDPWHTSDDLEDLAARDYPLTTADLDQIGPHCRPPASYYAEESKPF